MEYAWFLMADGREVYRKVRRVPLPARSDLPCPMLISDSMPAAEHVDGNFYDSKSEYRRVTKAKGLVEVGNDAQRFRTPVIPDRDKAIEASIDRAIARAS
jgi:hypothetical protein